VTDTSMQKVNQNQAQPGSMGQIYLAGGDRVALRLWDKEPPNQGKSSYSRDYETVGYVLEGRAVLHLETEQIQLQPGDSWVVPAGVRHRYEILEPLTAIEATSPPAREEGRDRI
jgi:mannose-6-phosphate isomerase-like protein (cupin superfamily)